MGVFVIELFPNYLELLLLLPITTLLELLLLVHSSPNNTIYPIRYHVEMMNRSIRFMKVKLVLIKILSCVANEIIGKKIYHPPSQLALW